MIESIIFDIGNTLYSFDEEVFYDKLSRYSDLSKRNLKKLMACDRRIYEIHDAHAKGKVDPKTFFEEVKKVMRLNMDEKEYSQLYMTTFVPLETLTLLDRLKPGHKLGILSDMNSYMYHCFLQIFKQADLFDALSISFESGFTKLHQKSYEHILGKLGSSAQKCIFIDDVQRNVRNAEKLGLIGIEYTSFPALLKDLNRYGIKV